MLKNILIVGAGGFAGSIARYLVYLFIEKRITWSFPVSTFAVNIIGSLLLGIFAGMILRYNFTETARLAFAIGFCGSFTTFSTFAYENMQLISQKPMMSAFYIITSVAFGLGAVFFGYFLGSRV